jgi:hypothetical protein
MYTILFRLVPDHLNNPDLDIRYLLPDLLAARSDGIIKDDGYDYASGSNHLHVFVTTTDIKSAMKCILDLIDNVRVLDNDLRRGAAVAIKQAEGFEVVFPPEQAGRILSDVDPIN